MDKHLCNLCIQRQLKINEVLSTWNENMFGPLSLHWSTGSMAAWLELGILYRFQGSYMPH